MIQLEADFLDTMQIDAIFSTNRKPFSTSKRNEIVSPT